jgi:hypothetical protein
MDLTFLHHIPKLPGNEVQIQAVLTFLKDHGAFGSTQILWEDPVTKYQLGFKISRVLVKEKAEYYRLPPEMSTKVCISWLLPQFGSCPTNRFPLSHTDQELLVDVLLKELRIQQRG